MNEEEKKRSNKNIDSDLIANLDDIGKQKKTISFPTEAPAYIRNDRLAT